MLAELSEISFSPLHAQARMNILRIMLQLRFRKFVPKLPDVIAITFAGPRKDMAQVGVKLILVAWMKEVSFLFHKGIHFSFRKNLYYKYL